MKKRLPRPENHAEPAIASMQPARWPAVLLATGATLYFAAFVLLSPVRQQLLSLLAVPDLLIAQWFAAAGVPLGFFDRVPVLAVAGLILAAAYGAGRLTVDRLRLGAEVTGLERSVFALALGLNWLSLGTLGLGLAALLSQWWLFAAIVAGLSAYGGWVIARDLHTTRNATVNVPYSTLKSAICNLQFVISLAAAVFVLIILLGSLLPPWDFDVREYHLQVPKEWFQQGRIDYLPHNIYGNMPLGAEMQALLAMTLMPGEQGWFYGALAGKVVIASYSWLTAAGLFAAGRRMASAWAGGVAAAVYLAHPWVVHVSISGLNDGALAANVFLSAYALWLSRSSKASPLLAGFLAGAAAACKYPGLAFAVAPLAIWAILPSDGFTADGWRRLRWSAVGLFLIGALTAGGPWYAKNLAQTGNPFFPLASSVFSSGGRTPEQVAQWEQAHQVPRDEQGRRYSLSQLVHSGVRIAVFDNLASPLVVPLFAVSVVRLLAGFYCKDRIANCQFAIPFFFLLIYIPAVWWLASHRLDRFLLPAWPLAALLAAFGAAWFDDRIWRYTTGTILAFGLGFCLLAGSSQLVGDNRWFVALDHLRREPWSANTPYGVSAAHLWLNEHSQPSEAVLLVGDAAPFDLEPRAFYNTCFDHCLLCDWMLGKSVVERKEQLASRRIAWVCVDENEIRRYRSPGNYGFDPRYQPGLLDNLVLQGILGPPQEITPGVAIYQVRP